MARLIVAFAALLFCAAECHASVWPMPEAAASCESVFPVDMLEIQRRVETLEDELTQARREQADAVTAMAGLLNAVESLQARLDVAETKAGGYPTHPQRWNVNGNWNPSREELITHLQSGQHAGKFSASWLESLSVDELKSLHDDDHEGKAQPQTKQPAKPTPQAIAPQLNCPSGKCPTYSYQYVVPQAQQKRGLFSFLRK